MDEYDLINTMNWIKINHTVLQGQIRGKKKKLAVWEVVVNAS